jgi:hypothetical protein
MGERRGEGRGYIRGSAGSNLRTGEKGKADTRNGGFTTQDGACGGGRKAAERLCAHRNVACGREKKGESGK